MTNLKKDQLSMLLYIAYDLSAFTGDINLLTHLHGQVLNGTRVLQHDNKTTTKRNIISLRRWSQIE